MTAYKARHKITEGEHLWEQGKANRLRGGDLGHFFFISVVGVILYLADHFGGPFYVLIL